MRRDPPSPPWRPGGGSPQKSSKTTRPSGRGTLSSTALRGRTAVLGHGTIALPQPSESRARTSSSFVLNVVEGLEVDRTTATEPNSDERRTAADDAARTPSVLARHDADELALLPGSRDRHRRRPRRLLEHHIHELRASWGRAATRRSSRRHRTSIATALAHWKIASKGIVELISTGSARYSRRENSICTRMVGNRRKPGAAAPPRRPGTATSCLRYHRQLLASSSRLRTLLTTYQTTPTQPEDPNFGLGGGTASM
ncbi:unnamed protein product, partial [Prorocentrum cordatum]